MESSFAKSVILLPLGAALVSFLAWSNHTQFHVLGLSDVIMCHLIYSPNLFFLLLAWIGLLSREARGYVNVSLVAVGYNYAADLVADSWSYRTVVRLIQTSLMPALS